MSKTLPGKRPSALDRFAKDLQPGVLEWIGLRSERRGPMLEVQSVEAIEDRGLAGDHRVNKSPGSGRQVTLISREFIQQTAHFLQQSSPDSHAHSQGIAELDPSLLRRNLVVSGINLHALRHQRFTIGEALLEAGALCHPCSRMETALGKGGVAAMLGHGGLCCRIIRSGRLNVGDAVIVQGQTADLFD